MTEANFSNEELTKISRNQKRLIWLVLFNIINQILSFSPRPISDIFPSFAIMIVIVGSLLVLDLAKSLKLFALGYVIGCFVPVISICCFLFVANKATKVLQKNGIRVGLMGANESDIVRLAS